VVSNAVGTRLPEGLRIVYQLRSGVTVEATVVSEYGWNAGDGHPDCVPGPAYGYICRFDDDGEEAFADERRIIGWYGKP
jgi:hypothetical protein